MSKAKKTTPTNVNHAHIKMAADLVRYLFHVSEKGSKDICLSVIEIPGEAHPDQKGYMRISSSLTDADTTLFPQYACLDLPLR